MTTTFDERVIPGDQLHVPDTSVVLMYPTRGDCRVEFHRSVMLSVIYDKAQGWSNLIGERCAIAGGGQVAKARNELVREFLEMYPDGEWLWFVDDDMVLKPETLPTLLVAAQAAGAKVMGALCVAVGDDGPIPTIYQLGNLAAGEVTRMMFDYQDDVVVQVAASGTGCLLIHRDVLEAMQAANPDAKYPWFEEREIRGQWVGEDVLFTLRCNEMGFPVFVHCGAHVGHVRGGSTWWPTDIRTRRGFPPARNYAVIPTKNRLDLLAPLVHQLREQGDLEAIIVVDNGSGRQTKNWLDSQDDLVVLDGAGMGIHEMWNAAVDHIEAQGQRRNVNVAFLNNDLRLGPRFIHHLAEALRSDRNLVAVSGNYDGRNHAQPVQLVTDICAGRMDGTGGLAGFAFMATGEWFLSGYRFPTECRWWYGDNDLVLAALNVQGRIGIAIDAQVEHIDGGSQTGDWADPEMQTQLELDRQAFEARWRRIAAAQAAAQAPPPAAPAGDWDPVAASHGEVLSDA